MRFRGKTSRALKHLPGAIAQDEVVEFILAAEMGGDPGVLVLTSDRLLFIGNARTDWALRSASVGQITGALVERGTMRHTVTVALDDGALILTTVDRPAADAFAGLLHVRLAGHVLSCVGPAPRAAPAPAPATPAITQSGRDAAETPADPATAPNPGVDAVTAMAQLRKLLDLGLITESEFERKKAEILDRL